MIYRKKPVCVKALQWTGKNYSDICNLIKTHGNNVSQPSLVYQSNGLVIHTLEGDVIADVNDYIIIGVKGEAYPCKPEIFEMTYDFEPNEPSLKKLYYYYDTQLEYVIRFINNTNITKEDIQYIGCGNDGYWYACYWWGE